MLSLDISAASDWAGSGGLTNVSEVGGAADDAEAGGPMTGLAGEVMVAIPDIGGTLFGGGTRGPNISGCLIG